MAKREPKLRTKLPLTFYVSTIGPYGATLIKDKPHGLPVRRVRVTDAACPVARAERAVVRAARWYVTVDRKNATATQAASAALDAAVLTLEEALRAAKRRRP